jgi:hypothetical protein
MADSPGFSPVPRRLFVVWLGPPMPALRAASLAAIRTHVGVETVLVKEAAIGDWVTADAPLHPAFARLSAVHQADYLRCHLMHYHGGGYVDVKPLLADWRPSFDHLDGTPEAVAVGYREPGPGGVAALGLDRVRGPRILTAAWWHRRWLQLNHRSLIGTCGFICRPRSPLTTAWHAELSRRLDGFAATLADHPARHPRDHAGFAIDGSPSGYPVPWTALLGDVFHPLVWRHRHRILKTLPPPRFEGYT